MNKIIYVSSITLLSVIISGCQQLPRSSKYVPEASRPVNESPTKALPTPRDGETIMLSGQGLTKIGREIFDRKGVTVLDVSDNALTGALPAEIRLLSGLTALNASNNDMTGIPAEIGQLRYLRTLNYADNAIDTMPNEIQNLSNLRFLSLANNKYRTVPDSVVQLKGIQTLDLTGNPLEQGEIERVRARMITTEVLF